VLNPVTFGRPYYLLLLLLLPALAWLRGRHGEPPAFLYSSAQLLRGMVQVTRHRPGGFLAALRWLALALLVVALAQPRLTRSEQKVTASGVDIVVALDMSGSMAAEDFELRGQAVNRLAMAKEVLRGFIAKRPNDRIGLVAFARMAYVAGPLTLDHDFLLENLERLQIGTIDASQTAIGSALSTALNRLQDVKSKSKIVILMTDGQNNAGQVAPLTAAEVAQALGVKVYTIGVGTRGLARVPQYFMGRKVGYTQQAVDIDEGTLKEIAKRTGGRYDRADSAGKFQEIYAEIDRLEKTEAQVKKYAHHRELFAWLAATGLLLVLVEVVLGHTIWRRLP
jgi:Ca-activated chloride channel family protein